MRVLVREVVHAALCTRQNTKHLILVEALPQTKNKWNKWNSGIVNTMKGDVSRHEKEREQEDAYTKTQELFVTPSLHLCFSNSLHVNDKMYLCSLSINA